MHGTRNHVSGSSQGLDQSSHCAMALQSWSRKVRGVRFVCHTLVTYSLDDQPIGHSLFVVGMHMNITFVISPKGSLELSLDLTRRLQSFVWSQRRDECCFLIAETKQRQRLNHNVMCSLKESVIVINYMFIIFLVVVLVVVITRVGYQSSLA